eukprot:3036738-Rhodomonas_salina.2
MNADPGPASRAQFQSTPGVWLGRGRKVEREARRVCECSERKGKETQLHRKEKGKKERGPARGSQKSTCVEPDVAADDDDGEDGEVEVAVDHARELLLLQRQRPEPHRLHHTPAPDVSLAWQKGRVACEGASR